ncbi:hypothetical protein SLEP1_g58504 [Rubroshorea leprosula]|uniref:Retrotransposon gag domain-containing protein n=1 Tax=Rubroshorea leprosula TaxID=152421 RepID=A0AAV5MQP6_9ROSI|nr:hypothetical protein SLEP1_g58504 [Rubroshorea leprosula]
MLGLVESQDMYGFLNGETPMPKPCVTSADDGVTKDQPNPDFVAWKRSDRLLRGWINGTLSEEVLGLAVGLETSAEIWNALEEAFAHSSQEQEFQLNQSMTTMRKGNDSIHEYIRKFKTTCDELAAIGKPMPDKNKVFWLLQGLGKEYENFVTTMLKPPVPSYHELVPLLKSHEARTQLHDSSAQEVPQMAFYSKQTNGGATSNFRKEANKSFPSTRNWHSEPPSPNKNNSSSRVVGEIKNKVACQICGKRNHTALKCFNRFNHAYQGDHPPTALAALTITANDDDDSEWHLDSGASGHMTANPETMESTISQPTELTQSHNVKSCTGQLNPSQDGHHDDDLPSIHVEMETNQNGAQNSSLPPNNSDDQFTSSNRPEVELSRTHNMVTRAQRGITKPNPRYAYLHKEIPT